MDGERGKITIDCAIRECYSKGMGKKHFGASNPNWKGGRLIASNGYILIRVGTDHHLSDVRGYAYEHRLFAEEKIGRRLRPREQVHHIDGNRGNNALENIEVMETLAHHLVNHRKTGKKRRLPGEPNIKILCACGCGKRFLVYDTSGRPRFFVSGHNTRRR